MTRDQRVFLVAVGEASAWDTFRTRVEAVCSSRTKQQHGRYAAIHGVLGAALSDPDDRITVHVPRTRRPSGRHVASLTVLGVLTAIMLVEWGIYTAPKIRNYMNYVEHRCGIR